MTAIVKIGDNVGGDERLLELSQDKLGKKIRVHNGVTYPDPGRPPSARAPSR